MSVLYFLNSILNDYFLIQSTSQEDDNDGVDISEDAMIEADDSDIDDSFVGVFVFEEKKRKSFSCLSPSEIVAYP